VLGGEMALRRFWIEKEEMGGDEFVISGDLFHHLIDVCRLKEGYAFELLPGDGSAYLVEITKIEKKSLLVLRKGERALPPLPKPHIHLLVSLPRLPKMDFILEKSVELGVKTLTPFVSDFSFLRKLSDISENRKARWEKVVKGATRQCGRGDLMEVAEVTSLKSLLKDFNQNPARVGLFPFEGEGAMTFKEALRSAKVGESEEVCVFIGSEGGFSEEEVKAFRAHQMAPLTLGDQVLRVETACVAVAAILKYELSL